MQSYPCLVSGLFFSRSLGATGLGPFQRHQRISVVFKSLENKMYLVYSEFWPTERQDHGKIFAEAQQGDIWWIDSIHSV